MAEDGRPVDVVSELLKRDLASRDTLNPGDEVGEMFSQREGGWLHVGFGIH